MAVTLPLVRPTDGLRTILAFAALGLANTILPFVVFKVAYLIIPYPQPVVLTIQVLPAVAAKLTLPHALDLNLKLLPRWTRPVALVLGWSVAASIAYVTPPNVPSPIRIFTVVLASVLSAAGDVFWLSQLRAYGRAGLQGWGVGTGAGLVVAAVLPYWVTVVLGAFFRDSIPYLSILVVLMVVSHFIILPRAPNSRRARVGGLKEGTDDADDDEETAAFLVRDTPNHSGLTNGQRVRSNIRLLTSTLAYPLILPLLLCSAGQAMTYSGFSRAMAATPSFDRYSAYLAAYGLVFQLGNLAGRSTPLMIRSRTPLVSTTALVTAMAIGAAAVLLNAVFLVASSTVVVFPLVFAVGVSVGLVYVETFAAVMERPSSSAEETEFSLGAVGVGEPVGLLLGGLVGYVVERTICGLALGSGQRWCDTTR